MSKSVQRGRKASRKSTGKKTGKASAATREQTREQQARLYDKAMALFSAGDLAEAKKLLDQVAVGPSSDIAHAAKMHGAACERRLEAEADLKLQTPEENYNYAVALINQRRPEEAVKFLLRALENDPETRDHIHYALAISYCLQNQLAEAAKHLQRSIELNPKNRTVARNDPDLEPFLKSPEISSLLRKD